MSHSNDSFNILFWKFPVHLCIFVVGSYFFSWVWKNVQKCTVRYWKEKITVLRVVRSMINNWLHSTVFLVVCYQINFFMILVIHLIFFRFFSFSLETVQDFKYKDHIKSGILRENTYTYTFMDFYDETGKILGSCITGKTTEYVRKRGRCWS